MVLNQMVITQPLLAVTHHASPPSDITRTLGYLDAHSGSLQVLTSAVLILVTAVYTVTRSMAKASQEALQPYVYLDLAFRSPAEMIVVIGNSGNKVAGHVTATLETSNSEKVAKLIRDLPTTSGIGHSTASVQSRTSRSSIWTHTAQRWHLNAIVRPTSPTSCAKFPGRCQACLSSLLAQPNNARTVEPSSQNLLQNAMDARNG